MELLYFFESIRNPFLTAFFSFWTLFGEETLLLVLICTIYWCLNKEFAYKIGIGFFASGLLTQSLKITFRIERPWIIDSRFKPIEGALETATGYSFPSGHTQASTSTFTAIALFVKNKLLKVLLAALIIMVGLSRMYLGVHTPADVVTAMLVSCAVTAICYYLIDKVKNHLVAAVILGCISAAVICYTSVLLNTGIISVENASDCFKSGGAGLGFAFSWYAEHKYLNFDVRTRKTWMQIVKIVVGLAAALLIKSALKYIIGEYMISHVIRYFATVAWVLFVYPLIFSRIKMSAPEKDSANKA